VAFVIFVHFCSNNLFLHVRVYVFVYVFRVWNKRFLSSFLKFVMRPDASGANTKYCNRTEFMSQDSGDASQRVKQVARGRDRARPSKGNYSNWDVFQQAAMERQGSEKQITKQFLRKQYLFVCAKYLTSSQLPGATGSDPVSGSKTGGAATSGVAAGTGVSATGVIGSTMETGGGS